MLDSMLDTSSSLMSDFSTSKWSSLSSASTTVHLFLGEIVRTSFGMEGRVDHTVVLLLPTSFGDLVYVFVKDGKVWNASARVSTTPFLFCFSQTLVASGLMGHFFSGKLVTGSSEVCCMPSP